MRTLIIASCLIATIWGYHIKKHDFNVVLDKTEYRNVPSKYHLNTLRPIEDILKGVVPLLEKDPRAGTEAILNDYADQIFANLANLIVHSGLDPVELPDQHTGFNYTLIITYHGELDLTKGWLQDISSLHRGGDVVVKYSSNDKYLEVLVPIAFDDLQFTYDYSAKIMGLGPTGGIAGKIANIGIQVKIGFNTATLQASLDEFFITDSGHIDLNFNGNALVDWLLNLLTDVITALLKEVILLVVEGIIRGGLETAVDAINQAIDSILNPGTTVAPVATAVPYFLN